MKGRVIQALLLIATSGLAQNHPRFAFSFPSSTLGATAVAVDSQGNSYLTGSVVGNPFTATPGAFQSQNNGGNNCLEGSGFGPPFLVPCADSFVIKLDPSGAVVFATYLGGTGAARTVGIAVDSKGSVYVAGNLEYGNFPVTPGAAFTTAAGADIGFIAKLDASGSQLEYSTLIPAAYLQSMAIDGAGQAYFTGSWSHSYNAPFPTTHGAFQMLPGNLDASTIAGKLNASGSALVYGTYLAGKQGPSDGQAIAVDAAGNALIAGGTFAADFPATAGTFGSGSEGNAFLAKLSPDGSTLIYASLLGQASVNTMKLSASGDAYVQCYAAVSTFPATGGFGVAPPAGGAADFLLHVGADGSSVLNAVYLPFVPSGLDVDSTGNAYLVGQGPVPTTEAAFQPSANGAESPVVIAKIAPDGQVLGATYTGTFAANSATSIATERDGSVVVAGLTPSIASPGVNTFLAENFFPAITIENSAGYVANTAVPGEKIAIQGYGLGPATGVVSAPVTALGGVQVYFDNFAGPIIYAQANQINVQVPWEIAGQSTTQVRIVYNGVEAGSVVVPVAQALPGVFYITNSDGSFNSTSNPARAGDLVSIYGTGGGVLSPPGVTGNPWPLATLSYLTQPVSVTVEGEAASVGYAGSAPTLDSGYFQINARLPADLTPAAQSLCMTIGGAMSVPVAISIR